MSIFQVVHFILVCVLLMHLSLLSALYTINCSQTDSCATSRVSCDTDDDCHIICEGDNVCNQKTFICPTSDNTQCNIECIGPSCIHTTFDASNLINGHLKLSIIANENEDQNVWSYGSLLCPFNGDCTIISTRDNIEHNHINALNAQSLNISIIGTDSQSNVLYESDVYCPIQSGRYCDININQGLLSNANIYTTQHQFLWIICTASSACYDAQHPATLYCGVMYKYDCEIYSENTLTQCDCYGSANPQISTQVTIIANENIFIHSQSNTATNLRYVIVILSSVIAISLIAVCCVACFAKMRHRLRLQNSNKDTRGTFDSISTSGTNNNTRSLSIKRMTDVKYLQSDTSMLSPNSMQSAVSSVQYTVNNLFGKQKEAPLTHRNIPLERPQSQPPIPPIAAAPSLSIGAQTVPGFGTAWNINNNTQYFGGAYANNITMEIQRNAPIIIPGAPYASHVRQPSAVSESESNLMAMSYAPVDGDISTGNCQMNIVAHDACDTFPDTGDIPQEEEYTENTTDDDGEIRTGNDTNELLMQLKKARYYKAKKHHIYQSSTSQSVSNVSKSQDHSMRTIIIKEENEFDYRFGTQANQVMSPRTEVSADEEVCDEEYDEAECTQYKIKVTHDARQRKEIEDTLKEGQLQYDDESTQHVNHMHVMQDDDAETTEYSFTENTNLTTATNTNNNTEDENESVSDNGHHMMSVIYVTDNGADDL